MLTYEINSHDFNFESVKLYLDEKLKKSREDKQTCSVTRIEEKDHSLSSSRVSYKYNFPEK